MYTVLDAVNCILYTVLDTVYSMLYIVLQAVHCILFTILQAVYCTTGCTLYTLHYTTGCILYTMLCTKDCIVYTVHYSTGCYILYKMQNSVYCKLYYRLYIFSPLPPAPARRPQCTCGFPSLTLYILYTVYCILYTLLCLQCKVYSRVYSGQYTVDSIHWTVYSEQSELSSPEVKTAPVPLASEGTVH